MPGNWRRKPKEPVSVTEPPQSKKDEFLPEPIRRMEIFTPESPQRRLADLIVPQATKKQLETLLAKIRYHTVLYVTWNLQSIDPFGGRTAINLYGPPGTGKSFCAEAIANELSKTIIRVNYAEIESKYVGETPKNIKAAFIKAKETDSVLFFDEADSILGRRLTNVTQSADHSVNVSRSVMLMELDRFEGITIFASNLASNYDGAFVRRILGHIEMPLPDEECRYRLWQNHIPKEMPVCQAIDFSQLAKFSDGLSGGEILNAVIMAASVAVQRKNEEQCVTLQDLSEAVTNVSKAKQEIGLMPVSPFQRVTERTISPDDLPEEIKQKLVERQNEDVPRN